MLGAAALQPAVVSAASRTFKMTAGPVQPSALPAEANLGNSAAISDSGKRLVVGADGFGNNAGAWYAYAVGKSINKTDVIWTQIQGPITGNANQSLGLSIGLSGSGKVAVVGAPGSSDPVVAGAAYVYTWSQASKQFSTTPQDLATLVSPAPPADSQFGAFVVISGNGKVIAVSQIIPRAVHIFTASRHGFVLAQTIPGGNLLLGDSLALSKTGAILVAGAPSTTGPGRVYTFQLNKGVGHRTWTQLGTFITRPGVTGRDGFGSVVSVSRSGKVLAVGAPDLGAYEGSVSVWAFSKTAEWTILQPALLPASPLLPYSIYGYQLAVSASGKIILVTSDGFSSGPGRVWTFTKTVGGTYTQTGAPLVGGPCPSTPISDAFGFSLALSSAANTLVVGAPNWRNNGSTAFFGTFYSFAART
jgi:hypothetical protein